MRGGFLMGAIAGAAVTTYVIARRNNGLNMAKMGTLVSNAIGDGFRMMTNSSQTAQQSASSSGKHSKQNRSSTNKQPLEQMIASDASVQKEVDAILSQNSH